MHVNHRHRRLLAAALCTCLALASGAVAEDSDQEVPAVTRITRSHFSKFFLSYTPDGSHLTYTRHHDNRRAANKVLMGLRIVRADGSDDRPLLAEFDSQVQIQEHGDWRPDGLALLITGGGNDTGNSTKDAFICDVDASFQASNLRKLVPGDGVQVGEQPVWSPDGQRLAAILTNRTLVTLDERGGNRKSLVQIAGNYCFQPAWSPDGEWIAFSCDRDGNCEVYKVRPDGTELTRLTDDPGVDCRPKWSPDGEWLAFTTNRDGNEELYVMRADGGYLRNLTHSAAFDDHAAWSPDGRSIAFVSMRDGGFDLYRLEVPAELEVLSAPRPRPARQQPTDSLAAHFTFDQEQDGLVHDERGGNHAQLFGARVVREGDRGHLHFSGQESRAVAGNGVSLQQGGPLTISLWVRPAEQPSNGYLVSKHGWNLYLGTDEVPRFETRTAANDGWDTLSAEAPLPVDRWSFVAAVFDPVAQALTMCINGQPAGSKARVDGQIGAADAYPLELGTYNLSHSQWYVGDIDELRIYARSLSEEELAGEYRRQSPIVTGEDVR